MALQNSRLDGDAKLKNGALIKGFAVVAGNYEFSGPVIIQGKSIIGIDYRIL